MKATTHTDPRSTEFALRSHRVSPRSQKSGLDRSLWLAGAAVMASVLTGVSGCQDYWYGDSRDVSVEVSTPEGDQKGVVKVEYLLYGDIGQAANVTVTYSTDGAFFRMASPAGSGEGTIGLSVSPGGTLHTFDWDSAKDLPGQKHPSVVVRVSPDIGQTERTASFSLSNCPCEGEEDEESSSEDGKKAAEESDNEDEEKPAATPDTEDKGKATGAP